MCCHSNYISANPNRKIGIPKCAVGSTYMAACFVEAVRAPSFVNIASKTESPTIAPGVLVSILLFRSRLVRRSLYDGEFCKQACGHLVGRFADIRTAAPVRMDFDLAQAAGIALSASQIFNGVKRLLRH
jgi:hypothetical protein